MQHPVLGLATPFSDALPLDLVEGVHQRSLVSLGQDPLGQGEEHMVLLSSVPVRGAFGVVGEVPRKLAPPSQEVR